ncbi:MAG: NADH-quinone oxidoreductase subunit NuoE [Candidatus Sericytochromatia bacterium]|nr:NADH-quinone oxidoreductase subunit NuoE [Candidatus Sericytochromatia bacterium]
MLEFSNETLAKFKTTLAQYPEKEAALLPTLWLAQYEFGYLSIEAMEYVAKLLDIPPSRVYSVASFYTMYKKEPTGKYLVQICRTLSCQLRGAEQVTDIICSKLKVNLGQTTPDNNFTIMEVECLGSCGTAPMMQINDDYYENLTKSKVNQIIDSLA